MVPPPSPRAPPSRTPAACTPSRTPRWRRGRVSGGSWCMVQIGYWLPMPLDKQDALLKRVHGLEALGPRGAGRLAPAAHGGGGDTWRRRRGRKRQSGYIRRIRTASRSRFRHVRCKRRTRGAAEQWQAATHRPTAYSQPASRAPRGRRPLFLLCWDLRRKS
jgi:hypothetical protein